MQDDLAEDGLRTVVTHLRSETIQDIEYIRARLQCNNNTDAMVRAVRLARSVLSEIDAGGYIELHRRNGDVKELLLK